MARPTKLTKRWIDAAKSVLNKDINAIIFTDEELIFLINEEVEEKERISDRTFQRWKSKSKESEEEELDEIGKSFVALIKKALAKQKKYLFNQFREEPNQWQRWAWIIERKFDDWNIKRKTDLTTDGEKLPTPIIPTSNEISRDNSDEENQESN